MGTLVITSSVLMLITLMLIEFISERRMTAFVVSLAILVLGMVMMIELAWLGFVAFWGIRLFLRFLPKFTAAAPLLIAAIIFGFHLAGYKFFGRPMLEDNRPLIDSPLTLDHLEQPNILVATDGSKHELRGVRFITELADIPHEQIQQMIDPRKEPLRFAPVADPNFDSGYAGELHMNYWCGNTWFPHFFPRHLPSHRKEDVTRILTNLIAKPSDSKK
ncbi:MAG: hypothetical protein NTV80_26800 [Verrucomicrobia bacterium]|nr:hypothetical protein [Verrucomicrobiota bacterium]